MSELEVIFSVDLEKATKNKVKSTSRKIYDLLKCIDTALDEGYRHKAIFEFLNSNGLLITWASYDKAIQRARAKVANLTNQQATHNRIKNQFSLINPETSKGMEW